MNYKKLHDNIITKAKTRTLPGYSEKHHIIPKCLGGDDEPDNLVRLTAREHFIIHKLLVEMYPESNELKFALWSMATLKNDLHERGYKVSGREYERLKIEMSEAMRKFRSGRKHSESTKQKIANAHKGKVLSESHKENIRASVSGYKHSEEAKRKIGEYQKNKPKIKYVCPHCKTEGSTVAMKRWHFDNCKYII